jgi:FkbM family methyltransferase
LKDRDSYKQSLARVLPDFNEATSSIIPRAVARTQKKVIAMGKRLFSRVASIQLTLRKFIWETQFLAKLGQTWPERMSIAKLIVILYLARLMPFSTREWETTIVVHGARYVIGVRTSEIFIFHEIYVFRQYERHAEFVPRSGWTVFDVGANIGVFTVIQAMHGARVFSFEPNPESYRRLVQNVILNNLRNVQLFPTALGDEQGMGSLHVTKGRTTGGVVVPVNGRATTSGVPVPIATLDEVVSTLPGLSIDLLKIDAEGSEVAILLGGERTLDHVQRIIVEYHSRDLLEKVREILDRKGFAQEMIVDYYAEDNAIGVDEVGIMYAGRSPQRRLN